MDRGILIIKKSINDENASFTHNNTGIELAFSKNDFHIGKYALPKDTFLYVNATDAPGLIKSYTIIEGQIMDLKSREVLTSGDIFIVGDEDTIHSFYNLEDTLIIVHEQVPKSVNTFKDSSSKMIQMLNEIQLKDNYTKEHSERVYHLAKEMGLALKYHSNQIYNLNKASRFHDIGKVFIDDYILNKPSGLNDEEYSKMKEHTKLSRDTILDRFGEEVFDIINQHHERLDGSGYPLGLTKDQILEESKILAICDSFDAMTTERVYKRAMSHEEAFEELESLAGKLYDPELVTLFIKLNR